MIKLIIFILLHVILLIHGQVIDNYNYEYYQHTLETFTIEQDDDDVGNVGTSIASIGDVNNGKFHFCVFFFVFFLYLYIYISFFFFNFFLISIHI